MQYNLNVGTMIDYLAASQNDNSIVEKFCYGNIASNCTTYGGLYSWDEAMKYISTEGSQGICSVGYHIPSYSDFTTLITFLGGTSVAGGAMKATGTTYWSAPNTGATNSSGFNALGAGLDYDGPFGFNINTHFWTSTSGYPKFVGLQNNSAAVTRNEDFIGGKSVRCLHN